ncbi:hypothetical protein BS47DRAFT_1401817 [Hydnum rufescens UP504]|uniref:Uncharacterized protein n=1 Tax=Hydnum rufescens UP504 TaxID=1448309 RepID=A0A9P6DHP5_9AGAM|nr:hypothetical protein BS47DRAFT_1401817 [Hydnum rufescens UP504]
MGNSKTYKKPRGPGSNKSQHTADSSEQLPLPPCVNRAVVKLELRSHPRQAAFKEHTGPPSGAKHLDEVTQQGTKSQASRHPSPLVPIPLSSHASSPPPPMFSRALTQTKSPSPIVATSSSPAHFPMVDDGALEDEINAPEHPLFLSDDGYESDSNDPVADQEDVNNLINGDNDDDDDDLDKEVVSSMVTGGHFTREQVLEVKGLANDLMAGLRHRAKAWEHPLDAMMRIANLVIATKERRAGGNAWNAYQNAFPEDPEKATYIFLTFTAFPGPHHEYVAEVIKPTYLALISEHGGSQSEAWKRKVKELVAEHMKHKVVTAQKISLNAAELGSQMKSLNKRWSDDIKWGAKLNMHIMYIIISGNPDVAASKHNTMVCGMSAMQKWCKAELPVQTSLLPKIHLYIIATEGLMGIRPTQAPKQMPPDMHAKRTVCTAELTRLFEECSGATVGSKFPWGMTPAFLIRHHLWIKNWPATREFPDMLGFTVSSVRTEHWTNLWNRLFTVDDNKRLTVKRLEPPEDQALQPTTMLVHNSDDLTLRVADWEGEVAKKKPSAKDGSVPSEQGGTSGDPNPDDGADGTTRPNPKRRRKNEVADGSGTRRGAKRKKVVSNLIIEDEDEGPQAMSTHSIGPALSSTSTPPSPLPVFGVGTMGPPMADVDVTSVVSSMYHSTFEFMPMDINDFPMSNVDVDFSQFPGLDIFENQDLLLGTPAGLL